MKMITAKNGVTGTRTNLFEIKVEGRTFWFLPAELSLAEGRPVTYVKE